MIKFIEQESNMLGYRVARGGDEALTSTGQLLDQLKSDQIDILKLSLNNTTPDLYTVLNSLGLPYYMLGMVIEYRSDFRRNKPGPYLNNYISFEEYKGQNSGEFKQMVGNIFGSSPTSYYMNPGLVNISLGREKQIECLVEYIESLSYDPMHYTHILSYKGEIAGFITSYRKGTGGGVLFAGVLKEHEGKGLFLDIIRFIQEYGKSIGQKWGVVHVQLQNTVAQKSFQRMGMVPSGYALNIHINSFFGVLSKLREQSR